MLKNTYSLIHETFPDEQYRYVRNLQYRISFSALTARFDPMFYRKTKLSKNQTEKICAIITSAFDYINISDLDENVSSIKKNHKTLYAYIEKRRFFLNITELESPSIASYYK